MFVLVFILVFATMPPVVVGRSVIVILHLAGRNGLHRRRRGSGGWRTADCSTGGAADCRPQDCSIPTTHRMADCSTRSAANRTADYRAPIYGIGIHASQ